MPVWWLVAFSYDIMKCIRIIHKTECRYDRRYVGVIFFPRNRERFAAGPR